MSEDWFYASEGNAVGPVDLHQLVSVLSRSGDWKAFFIWRDGFSDWLRAEDVQDIRAKMVRPPPPPSPKASQGQSVPNTKSAQTSRIRSALSWGVVLIAALIGMTIGKPIGREVYKSIASALEDRPAQIEKGLVEAENKIRPTLPKKVDAYTTMVAISHVGSRMRYDYVVDAGENKEIPSSFAASVKDSVLSKACTALEKSLAIGVTYDYAYRDTKQRPIGSFTVVEADCKVPRSRQ